MPSADTSRVGHLAPRVEFHRFLSATGPMVAYSGTIVAAQPLGVPRHTHMPCGPAPNSHAAGPDIPGERGGRGEHGMACRVPDRATCNRSSWEPPPLMVMLSGLLLVPALHMGLKFRLVPSLPRVLERGCGFPSSNLAREGHWLWRATT
jgi:hypothetical protein